MSADRGAVVVTGGSRGIGAATARLLAAHGYRVCIAYATEAQAADAVVAAIRRAGGQALAVSADVACELSVERLFAAVDDAFGLLGGLVNNAGIVGTRGRLEETGAEVLGRVLGVNVLGTMLCARAAVRRMSTRRGGVGGVIVNVSSGAATLGAPGEYVHYAASKGAVDSFTLGLAKEVAADGIRVNAVSPGIIDTDIHARAGAPDRVAREGPSLPLGRAGTPAEVAESILWLMSPAASYVTGANLRVAGGR